VTSGERTSAGAAIHDLGYKRYVGTRRPQSTRWRVIVGNLVTTSWRGWWRMKMWIIGAILTTVGIGVPMYISRHEIFDQLKQQGVPMTWADALLPMSFQFYSWFGFVLGATVAAAQVARDLRAGAFEFYFSRPVRPVDYMLGKVGGVTLVMACALAAGPLLLSLFRVGLSREVDEILPNLVLVPRTALVGLVAALAYAAVPLALSTLSPRPRITIAMWVAFYFVFGGIASGLAHGLGRPDLAALSISDALVGFSFGIYGVEPLFQAVPSIGASTAALCGYTAVGLAVLHARVRRAERAGLGGG
jgi:ABC-type transport system involved in multi-copper enzyme maturation permease subunit